MAQDICNGSESVCDCNAALQQMRTDDTFKKIFKPAEQQYGKTIEVPRIIALQENRDCHIINCFLLKLLFDVLEF